MGVKGGLLFFVLYVMILDESVSLFFKRWKTSDDLSRTNCILFNTNVFCCVLLASWIMLMMGRSKWYCILILFHLFLQMKTLTIIVLLGGPAHVLSWITVGHRANRFPSCLRGRGSSRQAEGWTNQDSICKAQKPHQAGVREKWHTDTETKTFWSERGLKP